MAELSKLARIREEAKMMEKYTITGDMVDDILVHYGQALTKTPTTKTIISAIAKTPSTHHSTNRVDMVHSKASASREILFTYRPPESYDDMHRIESASITYYLYGKDFIISYDADDNINPPYVDGDRIEAYKWASNFINEIDEDWGINEIDDIDDFKHKFLTSCIVEL
ncbi:hypothetical protein HOB87_10545 [Candidatus Woesearchaeota archaeon]|jgi:hypothetical protein|nr:hypothetical protein [Candidatus Woesearchaeota archaeon]